MIQGIKVALPHPYGRNGTVHGIGKSIDGRVTRGQLPVIFYFQEQNRQILLLGPSLSRHGKVLLLRSP
jgi:hypothetical protein